MKKKIGILVIHGIGEQEPFETLDAFANTFLKQYLTSVKNKFQQAEIHKKHILKKFSDKIESCVSITTDNTAVPGIDVYEYYWAYMTQREITFREIWFWLLAVSRGAKAFYDRHEGTQSGEMNDTLFNKDGEFKNYKYLLKMLSAVGFFQRLWFLAPANIMKIFSSFGKGIFEPLQRRIVDSFGDVVLYTTIDEKSKYYRIRQEILSGSFKKMLGLLECGEYDEILLVGHSLGTAIAYDTLARINKQMNVDPVLRGKATKIKGLVTFGSPLDKIAFFFDEKINKEKQPVRYAIASQLHGFKRVNVDTQTLESGVDECFSHVKWLNFWSKRDFVSGHLDVYRDLSNIEMDFSKLTTDPIKTHSIYWESEDMYKQIIAEYKLID